MMRKADLSQQYVKSILHYDPKTGDFVWKKRVTSYVRIGEPAGHQNSDGNLVISIDGQGYLAKRVAILYIDGAWPKGDVVCIDCDRSNLRYDNFVVIEKKGRTKKRNIIIGEMVFLWSLRKEHIPALKRVLDDLFDDRPELINICWHKELGEIDEMVKDKIAKDKIYGKDNASRQSFQLVHSRAGELDV